MTAHKKPISLRIFIEYLSGKTGADDGSAALSAVDVAHVEQWSTESDRRQQMLDGALAIWNGVSERSKATVNVESMKQAVAAQTQSDSSAGQQRLSREQYRNSPLRGWLGIGAVIALIVLVGGIFKKIQTASSGSLPGPAHTYTTQRGQYAKLNLPDGSTILVAPATTISYGADFGKQNREITLQGGALFTVVKGGHPPFIVRTNNTTSRVLGTTFAVRKFAEDSAVTVVVAEGKVEVAAAGQNDRSVLTMGDQLQVGQGTTALKRGIDISAMLGWATGRLDFRDVPFNAVLAEVSRAYNMDLRASSEKLGNRTVSLVIERMSPNSVIDMLAAISGSQIIRSNNTIIFKEQ